ncbi:MAG TPA: DegT/DnrJ/EryC1/StrS family aminotransferase [Chthoniobacterales bacterium]|jgi:dTDP-4-amino-4,6-dideoxygalactose transaminase|nr:DegT/DnrJ/EryC1/StrS family aminotransferase [Chthoniobacterales bacterium]
MNNYWQSDPAGVLRIPVARPRLPLAAEIVPYLRRIDEAQWYSNGGPLVTELEHRLAFHFGDENTTVATVANATIGLTLALFACDLPRPSLCMVPAWTFAASAHAIEFAGLVPWIVDVDETSWSLSAEMARALLRDAPGQVSAVMPVAPFGAPIDFVAWEKFREETGIAVVIDAAASFDTLRATQIPAVVSLHATKLLGAGEGGLVVINDANFGQQVQQRANFGFWNSREAKMQSLNGKLSEYAAAVGLAALDGWPETRADFAGVARVYGEVFAEQDRFRLQSGLGENWVSSTVVATTPPGTADAARHSLGEKQIGTRRWWGGGLHRHRAFAHCPRLATPVTDGLADGTIGLPCWRDLPPELIAKICAALFASTGACA